MNAIFVGEKRSGKTTLAFHMALETSGGVIVFDPKKEFLGWPATVTSIPELEMQIREKHNVIIYRPAQNQDVGESFDALADWVLEKHDLALAKQWDKIGYHFTLLIDEAYNLQSHAWINEKLLRILSQCRPEILNVFQTFQSIKNVNSDSRSRVSDWFLFTITLPTDLKRLEEFAMPEVIDEVQHLNEHEYVHFINEKGTVQSTIVIDSGDWYESLEFQQENKESEENEMARGEREGSLGDLFEDFLDWLDESDYEVRRREDSGNRRERNRDRDRDNDRDRDRNRSPRRERSSSSGGYEIYRRAS